MSDFQLATGYTMHYEEEDFTDPWTAPETVLLLHGNCESGLAWFGWVPISPVTSARSAPICAGSAPQHRCRATSSGAWTRSSMTLCG